MNKDKQFSIGFDPYAPINEDSASAFSIVRKPVSKEDGEKMVAEFLGRGSNELPYPELLEQMKELAKFYNAPILEEKTKYYIGIDNGVTGSIGMISDSGYEFHTTPVRKELNYTKAKSYISRINATELIKILSKANKFSHVMIERPMVNPSRFNATVSALRAFEATVTILETLGLSYEVVDSKKWQKELLPSGVSGDELKPASLSVGKRLFPNANVGKHTDMDGMLIAEYCRRCKR